MKIQVIHDVQNIENSLSDFVFVAQLYFCLLYIEKRTLKGNPIRDIYKLFSQIKTRKKKGKSIQNQWALKLKYLLFDFDFL